MFVVGTAGHVDHGKSTLVKALTGIDPDRLQEEQARGMTIDLGFAWLTLSSGREVSIVDVPGHERFIKNMLAGVGGIDLALLIVAADEGVMPQTREHLAILDLLQVRRGIIVITKRDLVEEDFIDLVRADVAEAVKGTTLRDAPMVAVSAFTGAGLDDLRALLDTTLDRTEARKDLGRPRLPIDRAFSIQGFGTVVTGTLVDGTLSLGQEVALVLSGKSARVRGLQSHRKREEAAQPGTRTAVNLSGVSPDEVTRGEVLSRPGWLTPTTMLDVRVRMAHGAARPLRHNQLLTLHAFTRETQARVRLLEADELTPGQGGWAQLILRDPVAVVKGDLFVLRSAEWTLAGGNVVEAHPARRWRRHHAPTLQRLEALARGTPEELVLQALLAASPADRGSLARRTNLTPDAVTQVWEALARSGQAVLLGEPADPATIAFAASAWERLKADVASFLAEAHRQFPLRRGSSREALRSRLGLPEAAFAKVLARLASEGVATEDGAVVRAPLHRPALSPAQRRAADAYIAALRSNPYAPPTDASLEPEVLAFIAEQGEVVRVSDSLVYDARAFAEMVERIKAHIRERGSVNVAGLRDLFGTSRKYALPVLEYLDQQRVTRRVGDDRVLR